MGGRAVGRIPGPRGNAVAPAIGGVAEERTAFGHFETFHSGLTRLCSFSLRPNYKRGGSPLPDIAHKIVQPVAVGFERSCRRCCLISIQPEVAVGKSALPDVAREEVFVVGISVAPRIARVFQATTRGVLPFSLVRQAAADPPRVVLRIAPGYVHDRMVGSPHGFLGARAIDVEPGRAVDPSPPFDLDDASGRPYAVADLAPEDERPAESFSLRLVPGCCDERGELRVRDRRVAYTERPDPLFLERAFSVVGYDGPVGSQEGPAAWNFDRRRQANAARIGTRLPLRLFKGPLV